MRPVLSFADPEARPRRGRGISSGLYSFTFLLPPLQQTFLRVSGFFPREGNQGNQGDQEGWPRCGGCQAMPVLAQKVSTTEDQY